MSFLTEKQLPHDSVMLIKRLPDGEEIACLIRDIDSEHAVSMFRSLVELAEKKRSQC